MPLRHGTSSAKVIFQLECLAAHVGTVAAADAGKLVHKHLQIQQRILAWKVDEVG